MVLLSTHSAPDYLAWRGLVQPGTAIVSELAGGVSNTVLLVETPTTRFVLKQALEKLRVKEDWRSDPTRALREAAAMQALSNVLPPNSIPKILFIDHENYAYAMEAAPLDALPWKTRLMAGDIDPTIARRIAQIQAAMVLAPAEVTSQFEDQAIFDQLRLDPYYLFTASRHRALDAFFDSLIDSCRTRRAGIVHGDWSPKNFLTAPDFLFAIDFEVVHHGNPAFDAAFLLNHLLLKGTHLPHQRDRFNQAALAYWDTLSRLLSRHTAWLEQETILHLGGLHLARIDGKSPAEYITTEAEQLAVRRQALHIIGHPPATIEEIFS